MSTPRQEAAALIQSYGLDRALGIARERLKSDRKMHQPIQRSREMAVFLEQLADALLDLAAIEQADPVADLARRLIDAGITEADLHATLGPRLQSPIGNELYNKYRDVARGVPTTNHYHKRQPVGLSPYSCYYCVEHNA